MRLFFGKSVEKLQVSSKSDKNKGYFNEALSTFMIISRYLLLRFTNDRREFHQSKQTFYVKWVFIHKSYLLWNYVEKYRRARPDTGDYDTCSLHGGNIRLQNALRVCNIYCCSAAPNVVRTILIVTVTVHWLSCAKWVVFKLSGSTGATLSCYRLPVPLAGRSAVCVWYICNS